MSSGDSIVRIDKLENGYEVEVCDAAIMEANREPKSNWQDPWKGYAFTTAKEAVAFIAKHLDTLKPPPDAETEYGDSFKRATVEGD